MPYQPMFSGPSENRIGLGVIGISATTWGNGDTLAGYLYSGAMTEQYIGWALVLGLAVGGALVWFAVGRLPRSGEEIPDDERASEAAWISETISQRGGKAPTNLVEEVLAMHAHYLEHADEDGVYVDLALRLPPRREMTRDRRQRSGRKAR